MFRRAAEFADRIARGVKPTELPIEQPTKFELVINPATARALGLDLAPTLPAGADDVIEWAGPMSPIGPSRRFAAMQQYVGYGGYSGFGQALGAACSTGHLHSGERPGK
jgi:hypothetical protein